MSEEEKEPSHALPMRYYGDPLQVILAAEAGTCKGCEHEATLLGTTFCTKGKCHGNRCRLYVERIGRGR